MEVRYATGPKDMRYYTTERLREEYLIPQIFVKDEVTMVYSHYDRIITGGAMPVNGQLVLSAGEELRAEYFLQRREMGIINIGGTGIITVDGKDYQLSNGDGMYIGMGKKDIKFESVDISNMPEEAYVMHYMGEPQETRHIVMRNEQAVISPSWSIHAGSGTQAYTFIWGMAGENQDFGDMDNIKNSELM